ncbi:electron transfer flavoprotein subunit alpha/FixB family protein [Bacillus sp. B15-48]|uniref:electron transfer flavoprotein subunit alpha/FixB family protein n=1 Tax=Bacillus sp. B15-48 TaxID=1548601 RepID=UPI001940183C|nr:electron transfer flavoprotein subunit alpha/FixB family protein [Bacillus sp. B15-48]MBM4762864.1 electron transfer flavoprotein subunit alpha/FixB family protein [Bacillus sp. B15-48]
MKNIWVIADSPEYGYELLSKIASKGDQVTAFVNGDATVANECFAYGASTVNLLPLPKNTTWEQYAKVIASEGKEVQPELIVVAATRRGKTVAAQVAALLDVPCITETKAIEIDGDTKLFTRTIYGGLAETELETSQSVVVSVTPGTFEKEKAATPENGTVRTIELTEPNNVVIVERKQKEETSVNLNDANVVVGVGRGFGNAENVKLAEELATTLGGEIGCTRPVAEDFHWVSEERYIGISGAVIKPNLYIGAGISGQIQHMYGVRDSKTIVAIDKNENAPIFKSADYYIVADINEVLPELISAVK